MWYLMYTQGEAGTSRARLEFIPLSFEDMPDPSDLNVISDINTAAALVWHGFLRGRSCSGQELGNIHDPEIVWRKPIDFLVLKPDKPQEDKPKEKEGVQA